MPLHALSDLSNVDTTASPTVSGLTVTNNLSVSGQIYAPNITSTLSSSVMTQGAADKRYGNMFVNILSADGPPVDNITVTSLALLSASPLYLNLSAGIYEIESCVNLNNTTSNITVGAAIYYLALTPNLTSFDFSTYGFPVNIRSSGTTPVFAIAGVNLSYINLNTTGFSPISSQTGFSQTGETAAILMPRNILTTGILYVTTPTRLCAGPVQRVATVGNPVTIKQGSWMIATQIG